MELRMPRPPRLAAAPAAALAAIIAAALPFATLAQEPLFAEGQKPGLRIEVRELARGDGGTATLKMTLVNESGADFDGSCEMREEGGVDSCGVFSGAYLLDAANAKKYLVVRDSDGQCVCSGIDSVPPGESLNLWATYPAPPAEVTTVTVIVPQFEPLEGVPVAE
jgi:hypothetical protein